MTDSFSVSIPDLEAMAAAFRTASSNLELLPGGLASRAHGPESSQVIGKAEAAEKYTRLVDAWRGNLDQIVTSVGNLSLKVQAAAQAYAQTEADNTPEQAP